MNIFHSITASLGNALILIVLRKVSSIHARTKHFYRSLAATNLCVGVLVQPLFATYITNVFPQINVSVFSYVYKVMGASSLVLCGLSVATSTAISVDRLLALLLGLRYRHIVTLTRVRSLVICLWLLSSLFGWVRLWKIDVAFKLASFGLVFVWQFPFSVTRRSTTNYDINKLKYKNVFPGRSTTWRSHPT